MNAQIKEIANSHFKAILQIDKLREDYPAATMLALKLCGEKLRNYSRKIHKASPKNYKFYTYSGHGQKFKTKSSTLGTPPALQTGMLYNSIGFEVMSPRQLLFGAGSMSSNTSYARYLELGKRPFLKPSIDANVNSMKRIIEDTIAGKGKVFKI